MTLPELMERFVAEAKRKPVNIGVSLKDSLKRAVVEERLTLGIANCVKLLESNPDNVLFCILRDMSSSADVTVQILHTLIEAFCWENDIKLLKVDDLTQAPKMVAECKTENVLDCRDSKFSCDVTCVLIERPHESLANCEEEIAEYYNHVIYSDVYPRPVLQIPS